MPQIPYPATRGKPMPELFRFYSKRRLNLASRYLGKSPCKTCFVQATCYAEGINKHRDRNLGQFEVRLATPCDEAVSWFKAAEALSQFILFLIKEKSPVLVGGPEEVKKACSDIRKALGYPD
jgi:hypothetical protein